MRDQNKLNALEENETFVQLAGLRANPVGGGFDLEHLQEIHRRIFCNIYPFAGELRNTGIKKPEGKPFTHPDGIKPHSDRIFESLKEQDYLRGLNPKAMSKELSLYLGAINSVHPFREGNGRTQREFMRELALHNDYILDFSQTNQDEMEKASKAAHERNNLAGLRKIIKQGLTPIDKHPSFTASVSRTAVSAPEIPDMDFDHDDYE